MMEHLAHAAEGSHEHPPLQSCIPKGQCRPTAAPWSGIVPPTHPYPAAEDTMHRTLLYIYDDRSGRSSPAAFLSLTATEQFRPTSLPFPAPPTAPHPSCTSTSSATATISTTLAPCHHRHYHPQSHHRVCCDTAHPALLTFSLGDRESIG